MNYKIIRLLGLAAIISYMTIILCTWALANYRGYVYFSAGEPVLVIKYFEWVLGVLGICVAVAYLVDELKNY
jgi:hypothetical protein